MCEIAVFDPEQTSIEMVNQVAGTFYREQEDGLGIVMSVDNGDSFDHRIYKSTQPHWQTVYSFLRRNWDETWRVTVHARAATSGKINRDTAHPIANDCGCNNIDYVVHNGSIRNHRDTREEMQKQGHDFNTDVDSELLAHKVGNIPETVEDHDRRTYDVRGNLNYLLFSDDGILARMSQRYYLSDSLTLTCRPDNLQNVAAEDNTTEWLLARPGGEIETRDRIVWHGNKSSYSSTGRSGYYARKSSGSRSSSSGTSASGSSSSTGNTNSGTASGSGSDDVPATYEVMYKDHASDIDGIVAIKTAPGVMRMINTEEGVNHYIFREENPKAYYYYAPDETPDNIEELHEKATDDETEVNIVDDSDSDESIDPDDPPEEWESEEQLQEYQARSVSREALVVNIQMSGDVSRERAEQIANEMENRVVG